MTFPGEDRDADLREVAEKASGRVMHGRHIKTISCRIDGHDKTVEVGATDAFADQRVVSIFQVGRTGYTVLLESTTTPGRHATVDLPRNVVYDATDYDR